MLDGENSLLQILHPLMELLIGQAQKSPGFFGFTLHF